MHLDVCDIFKIKLIIVLQHSWNPSYGILESQHFVEPNTTIHFLHEVITLYKPMHTLLLYYLYYHVSRDIMVST